MEKGKRDHKFRYGNVEMKVFSRSLDILMTFKVIKKDKITYKNNVDRKREAWD